MPENLSALQDLAWVVSRTCDGGQCVKVARQGEYVIIGNTGNPTEPISKFTTDEWRHFIAGVKLGDFDEI